MKYIPIQLPKGCNVSLATLNGSKGIGMSSGVIILASAKPNTFSNFILFYFILFYYINRKIFIYIKRV